MKLRSNFKFKRKENFTWDKVNGSSLTGQKAMLNTIHFKTTVFNIVQCLFTNNIYPKSLQVYNGNTFQ